VIGFVGGSITDARPGHNWPEPVVAWLVEAFPGTRIAVENAAIGATGSDLAVFRAERDLIEPGCDVVFIEYAVNDAGLDPGLRRKTQEGLVRKLLAGRGRDLVLVHTFCQAMEEDMEAGRPPPSVRELEALGAHYRIGSVWPGLHALRQVQAGRMSRQEWLPDGLHPGPRGSRTYAESVTDFLDRQLRQSRPSEPNPRGAERPEPLDPGNWESAEALPLEAAETRGPWTLRRWHGNPWIDRVLATDRPGAGLALEFDGRALCLGFDFGAESAEFRYRLDGADWTPVERERPDWCGPAGWSPGPTSRPPSR
jgi:hypothetical protein